jgi:hypothetical protein
MVLKTKRISPNSSKKGHGVDPMRSFFWATLLLFPIVAGFTACAGTEQFVNSEVGEPCELTSDCGAITTDGRTVQLNCYINAFLFPGGYCSQRCTPGATVADSPELACPEGSTCLAPREYDDDRDDGYCLKNCQADPDCDRGDGTGIYYTCLRDRGGRNICVHGAVGLFGKECDGMYQCQADMLCFTGDRFPYGYCSRSCESDSECPYDSDKQGLCIRGYCHVPCNDDAQCRENQGYSCLDIGGGRTFCGNKETYINDPTGGEPATGTDQNQPATGGGQGVP